MQREGEDDAWRAIVLRPGATPLRALDAALADSAGPRLIVVDQLEELFTQCRDPEERERFAARLVELAGGDTRVVATLRDDFLVAASELAPGKSLVHTHRTYHFVGTEAALDPIAKSMLGVTLAKL